MLLLAFVEPHAVVRGPMPPPAEGFYAAAPVVLVLLLVSLWVFVRRRRVRAQSQRRGGIMASIALSAALGNALVELGGFFQPDRPVAMAMERGDCERTPEGVGDGRTPPSHERSAGLGMGISAGQHPKLGVTHQQQPAKGHALAGPDTDVGPVGAA